MNKVIHAHALMDFIHEYPGESSLDTLKTEFEKKYGQVQFTNCTNQIYSLDEILLFLQQRNKIHYNSEGIEVIREHRCDHD